MSSVTISDNRPESEVNNPINILMVEDNRADVVLTQYIIDKGMFNHDLNVTQDGYKAIEHLKSCLEENGPSLPDLVILDLNLPKMGGIEFLQAVREIPELKELKVAVLTTSENPDELQALEELDVLCCMSKPANKRELGRLIEQFQPGSESNSAETKRKKRDTLFSLPEYNPEDSDSAELDENCFLDDEETTEEFFQEHSASTVLLIEDNLADAKLISKRLSMEFPNQFQIVHKSTLKEATTFLKEIKVDVITLDLGLPDALGMEAFEGIRKVTEETPIVVLTGVDDASYALEAVKRGAQDYLVKDAKKYGDVLGRILRYAIERKKVERVVQHSLKLEQNTLREVLDEAPLHIIRIDSRLRVKDINPMVVNTSKIPESEILGQDVLNLMPDLDRTKLEQLVKAGLTYNIQQLKVSKLLIDLYRCMVV